MDFALEVRDLRKSYKGRPVRGVSFAVARGEIFNLEGIRRTMAAPSGCWTAARATCACASPFAVQLQDGEVM